MTAAAPNANFVHPSAAGTNLTCSTAPGVVFASREALHEHYKSDWHRYNLRRRAAGLAPITKDVFERVLREAAARADAPAERKADHLKEKERKPKPAPAQAPAPAPASAPAPAAAAPTEAEPEEETEEQLKERVTRALREFKYDPRECLWERSGHVSEDVAGNLDHMHRHHGFVVPDLEYCVDLEGLLRYCAEKIWVGRVCLFCDKAFRDGDATMRHMTGKGHCRIPWDFEDQVDEYSDYYDFSRAPDPGAEGKTMSVDPLTQELVLREADGSETRYGSAGLRHTYERLQRESRREATELVATRATRALAEERALQVYRRAGVPTSSELANVPVSRRRLVMLKREKAFAERAEEEWAIKMGHVGWMLLRNRRAGKNVGAGHHVHG